MPDWLVPSLAVAVLVAVLWTLRPRRARVQTVPPDWRQALYARVPQASLVPQAQRALYETRVETLLGNTRFVGCSGLVVTDEMRLAVAGLAALMLLRPEARPFPAVKAVLLYPEAFLVPIHEPDEFGLVSDEPEERVGESWAGERVILSWAEVQAALQGDAVNVVVHEFAHQLDDEGPAGPGAPALRDYARWSEVMKTEYERLQRHRRPPVLDPYGAESPAEFFAVVTESFFQRPAELQRHHAELYALLAGYYRLDPAAASS